MKTKKIKKLVLRKLTIAQLGENESKKVQGGATISVCQILSCTCGPTCTNTCVNCDSVDGHYCN